MKKEDIQKSSDEELGNLYLMLNTELGKRSDKRFRARIEQLVQEGKLFRRLSDIKTPEGYDRKFNVRTIDARLGNKKLKIYHFKFGTYYYCTKCKAYVPGSPRMEEYDNREFLSGHSGHNYFCIICNSNIGRSVTGHS